MTEGDSVETRDKRTTNPVVILLGILVLAASMTWWVDAGTFERDGRLVVPGSYQQVEKHITPSDVFGYAVVPGDGVAHPVGVVGVLTALPHGLERSAGLIFMVLAIGGMFGILKSAGAIDSGLERVIAMVHGNIYVLAAGLVIIFALGSTFLGLASEYLLVIPLVVAIANRMGLSNIIGLAIVTIGTKVGYIASVTNPLPLTVAQPLVGLQIFSGADMRFMFFLVFLIAGVSFLMVMIRRARPENRMQVDMASGDVPARHKVLLALLALGIVLLVVGSNQWQWKHGELTAFYFGLSIILAAVSGLGASGAADAFVDGMKRVLMASMLIGVATAVSVVLEQGRILDTVVNNLTSIIGSSGPAMAASGMFVSQFLLDFLIPSTSGQAAVSMPILGPVGQLTGVSPQTTVLAFLFGNGLTNMITPTSGTLLAYLATAQVGWGDWARFILPLWIIFGVISLVLLYVAVLTGF